ncbi:hypothetical protein MCOR27_000095 [Pyricularia oryzae]|uniref:NmrA-like domain-containing protein n=2 Tax=Pyricularia TaxID=48558 RepID=A0ABQ8NXB3_PYRGI|nr:hypothetical protein MCOR01_006783 [Pyricularia oryzae]KAI6302947.1 hypothetical protein MCOR33_001857 [Pyricularia grisea]KAH9436101.1 hypothetical protein MCOR02_005010 [Pyricularia oryzae]KAI6254210.1 hypothetical protein MCOR19_009260 [Pyricularia oryzae]KAI6287334.1 hypothetical protein MCOR26_000586 [Pyricularia oryzae]
MSAPIKVVVFGATGHTGRVIIDGLIKSPTNFEIVAVCRPSSLGKPQIDLFKKNGVKVVGLEITGPREPLVDVIKGADTVIAALNFLVLEQQTILIDVCKEAGVGRFIPDNFGPVMPPVGVMALRERKEKIINYIKLQKVPYTVIDVAWWYQILPYKVPSGRIDYMVPYGPDDANHIPGEGNVRVSFSDVTAIGDKVARIIADPRTVNKYVHVYDEVMTYHQVLETLEDVSGEKIERAYKTAEQCQDAISEMNKVLAKDATNFMALVGRSVSEYQYSLAVRGDTTPEVADYLGYLDVYKLYPDLEPATLQTYYRRALDGKEAPGHMD